MRTEIEFLRRIRPYKHVEYFYWHDEGYLAWTMGTGDNYEMLFLETAKPRCGIGTMLYRAFCGKVLAEGRQPYHSCYTFTQASNAGATAFYRKLGFSEVPTQGVYKSGDAVLFWVPFDELCTRLGVK